MSKRVLDRRSVTVSLPATSEYQQALAASQRRLIVIVAPADGSTVRLANRNLGAAGGQIALAGTQFTSRFAYADYGPIVTDEIWLASLGVLISVTVTELYYSG